MRFWQQRNGLLIASFVLASPLIPMRQSAAPPQAAKERPEFEVATIKPGKPDKGGRGIRPLPGGQTYVADNVPVKLIIMLMFHVTKNQISGGPNWINTDLWSIEAKAAHPTNLDELHVMFQNLLIDRFNLKFHRESKEMPVYALVVDKSGSKLKRNDSPEPFDFSIKGVGRGKLAGQRCSMSYLTWFLAQLPMLDRPVIDETGLPGFYDFNFEWMPEVPKVPGADDRDAVPGAEGPSLFTALREQLGLRLDAKKGPVQVMVIDNIDKPSEN
jgi:uncharacterized protein (TIGR03435 family)